MKLWYAQVLKSKTPYCPHRSVSEAFMERGTALCIMEEDTQFRAGNKKNSWPNPWIPETFAAWE